MKFFKLFILCVFLLGAGPSSKYKKLSSGLEYRVISSASYVKLHVFRLDLKKFKLKTLYYPKHKSGFSAEQMQKKSGALLVLNANFFDRQLRPLGLVLADGKLQQPIKNVSWWASFLIHKKKASIQLLKSDAKIADYEQGLQAGPRLVVKGQALKLKRERSPKSAVGMDKRGRVYLIASEGSMEINQLAKLLATPEAAGGLGLYDALNLDGGGSTQLYYNDGQHMVDIRAPARFPVALAVF